MQHFFAIAGCYSPRSKELPTRENLVELQTEFYNPLCRMFLSAI